MVDFLQELRLLVEALLVNVLLLAGTFAVDLLDSPRRRIQLLLPGIQRSRRSEVLVTLIVFIANQKGPVCHIWVH